MSYTMAIARPPSTYDGRTTTGNPISVATARASSCDVAVPDAACGIPRSHSSFENRLRSSARSMESGDVPRMRTPAACSDSASLSGVWPPYCTTHDTSPPADFSRSMIAMHVLERERLEVQPIDRVVVGRHRLRIAVDHHGLVALLAQRERGVTAAVVELDALADPVRPAAENHDLVAATSDWLRTPVSNVPYMYGVNDSNSAAQVSMRL